MERESGRATATADGRRMRKTSAHELHEEQRSKRPHSDVLPIYPSTSRGSWSNTDPCLLLAPFKPPLAPHSAPFSGTFPA